MILKRAPAKKKKPEGLHHIVHIVLSTYNPIPWKTITVIPN